MRLKAGDRLDRFEIVEPLGEGAYAETYKARDTKSGDMVLIKSPNPLLFADPAIHQRFMRESEIARHLNHPGVQRSVDLGENRSEPYLALEYIEGDNWLAVMAGHLQRHPKPIHELRADVPRELEAIVLTAMRRYPENRYQSAEELLADLRALNLQQAPAPAPTPATPPATPPAA